MNAGHGMASRSSWWDTPHWVLCTCGELIKGDSMDGAAQSWRNHAAPVFCQCPDNVYEESGMDEFFGPTTHNPSPPPVLSLFEEDK